MVIRMFATGLAALLVLLISPAQAATPAQTYQREIFTATNVVRTAHQLPRFRGNFCLQRFAARQAQRMANQQRQFHQDLGPVLRRCGMRKVGENVAYGFGTGTSAVVQGWVKSPSHLRNIRDREFRLMGVGARRGDNGLWYAAQVFGRKR